MKKWFGSYGLFSFIISGSAFAILIVLYKSYLPELALNNRADNYSMFALVFYGLLFTTLMAVPAINKYSAKIGNDKWKAFLVFPKKEEPFTFVTFTDFLGQQALSSFLVTVLVFTGKGAFSSVGGEIIAVYTYLMYIIAISVSVISLFRVAMYFSESKWHLLLVSLGASAIALLFFRAGTQMGA